jgi:hypothetical protein
LRIALNISRISLGGSMQEFEMYSRTPAKQSGLCGARGMSGIIGIARQPKAVLQH